MDDSFLAVASAAKNALSRNALLRMMQNSMDVAVLRTFVEVMRRGSFSAVARERGVSPSSISRAISALEDEIGLRLFQRSTRQLAPTEAGQIYFGQVEAIVAELDRARLMAADVSARPRGTLRITAAMTFAELVLVPLLPKLRERYPELSVELMLSDSIVDLLAERVDVAVRLGSLGDSELVAHRLCPIDFVVCASRAYLDAHGHPRKPHELVDHECLQFLMGGLRSRWRFRDPGGDLTEVTVSGHCVLSNALALSRCAEAGMGVTLLPRMVVASQLRSGALIELFSGYQVTATDFDSAVWLLYPSRTYLALKVRVFIDFMKSTFADAPPWELPPGER